MVAEGLVVLKGGRLLSKPPQFRTKAPPSICLFYFAEEAERRAAETAERERGMAERTAT